MMSTPPPHNINELLKRAASLAGRRLGEVATTQGWEVPKELLRTKGWIGQLMENALGASAGNLPMPDFPELGVELKTIPIDRNGNPRESTYVCTVPLTAQPQESWEHSLVWRKLQCVLWIPILATPELAITDRIIGTPLLWRPSPSQALELRKDWEEFIDRIHLGQLDTINAKLGKHLQIRPKAADRRCLTAGRDIEGQLTRTLPRGFYLRTHFTKEILGAQLRKRKAQDIG
jgi:DNA mismatch repair protein MutH